MRSRYCSRIRHQRLVPHDIDISVVETVYDNKCEKVYETVYEV